MKSRFPDEVRIVNVNHIHITRRTRLRCQEAAPKWPRVALKWPVNTQNSLRFSIPNGTGITAKQRCPREIRARGDKPARRPPEAPPATSAAVVFRHRRGRIAKRCRERATTHA